MTFFYQLNRTARHLAFTAFGLQLVIAVLKDAGLEGLNAGFLLAASLLLAARLRWRLRRRAAAVSAALTILLCVFGSQRGDHSALCITLGTLLVYGLIRTRRRRFR
jgi:hypothetical protein